MAVKTTGAEFKRFYADESFWPEDTWHDGALITIDGEDQEDGIDVDTLADHSIVKIEGGEVMGPKWEESGPSLETYFRRWRKQQTVMVFTVECDNSQLDAVKAAIKAAGGRIL